MSYINYGDMVATKYIEKTREYLLYLEDHIENVRHAFNELSDICAGMTWVNDDYTWHTVKTDIINHDLSKFDKEEFSQYRDFFYPVNENDKENRGMYDAWENHKQKNHHHHETAQTIIDLVHMVIDWTAMGYKFGNTAQEYYEKNRNKIKLSEDDELFIYDIFDRIKKGI